MDAETREFVTGGSEQTRTRRKKLLSLRAGFGGVSAFGYPLGMIPGVQTPNDPPPVNPDQFGGGGEGQGDAGAGEGSGGDGGGGAP